MRFERDDAKVGLLVLVAMVLFGSLAFHRAIRVLFHRETLHQVELRNVSDLAVGTEVLLQGLRVGQTNAIEMHREGTDYHFVATLGIRPDVVLWRGTRGVLGTRIMGGSYLELRLPPAAERKVELGPGEVMPGETAPSLNSLVAGLEELTSNLNRAVSELRTELTTRGMESVLGHPDVRRALRDAVSTLGAIRSASAVTERTLLHGDRTLEGLDRNLVSLEKSLLVLQDLLERRGTDLDALIGQAGEALVALRQVGVQVDLLVRGAGPEAVEGLKALRRTLSSMEELLELLKAKPNRVVFGTPSDQEREAARKKVEDARKGTGSPEAPK